MTKQVTLAKNPFDPETWTTHEVENLCEFLATEFDVFPNGGRIYQSNVADANDVTPNNDAEIERLENLDGPFYVVIYPEGFDPYTIAIIIVIAVLAAAIIFAPNVDIPNTALRTQNSQQPSPNNELAERTNKARVMARVPDIYGTVRSMPDLIAVPYTVFIDHVEVENAYMCVGRGAYDISDIRDDTTSIADIAGSSIEVYAPNTSPNSGNAPQIRIGDPIATPIVNVVRSGSVNGQVLRSPNGQSFVASDNLRFVSPNKMELAAGVNFNFNDKFTAGEALTVLNAAQYPARITESRVIVAESGGSFSFDSNTQTNLYVVGAEVEIINGRFHPVSELRSSPGYDLSGVYKVSVVAASSYVSNGTTFYTYSIGLSNPRAVNPAWDEADGETSATVQLKVSSGAAVYDFAGVYLIASVEPTAIYLVNPSSVSSSWNGLTASGYISPTLSTVGDKWIGPFVLDSPERTKVYANFIAINGLFKDDGQNQLRFDVMLELEVTPINQDGSIRGAVQTQQATLEGSAAFKTSRAITVRLTTALAGRCRVRARRLTPSDLNYNGSVVDEIKWRDLYSVSDVNKVHFGNLTTVQSVTLATSGALTLKQRKLNMLASRRIESRQPNGSFVVMPTSNAADIMRAVCLDPFIGNRQPVELDLTNMYAAVASATAYFGTSKAGEFNYTFDSDNLSFEETVMSIANAVHCMAYRRGNLVKLAFEKATPDSTLLFNHRNKLPGTEVRTISFGNANDNDGVEYQYIDPIDDAVVTLYLPADRSALNPKKVESIGVRSRLQAYFHAWRLWNKIRYSNQTVEFDATQEADLVIPQDRILVADNTRPDTQDGEVFEQNGLELLLSQNVTFTAGVAYTIFLQHIDGSVESIGISAGSAANRVVLANPPRAVLALDPDLFARTTYVIVGNNSTRKTAFLVTEKEPQSPFVTTVKAVNYDDKYYANDKDYINNVVNIDGL